MKVLIFASHNKKSIMKKVLLSIAAASAMFASCQDAPKADTANATDAQAVAATNGATELMVDVAQTKVEFVGTKPVGKHHGVFMIKEGTLAVEAGTIKGGSFVIDMNTMKVDDQDSIGNAKLAGHLMSPDFFDVANHATARFEITSVVAGIDTAMKEVIMTDATHTITGNLTLKGVSKSISFPAKVSLNDAAATADANFNIDRTQWGLSYGNDKSLKDKFISPMVNIAFHLVATKAAAATTAAN
jgi:polyisoprenoid-binding protein YceI